MFKFFSGQQWGKDPGSTVILGQVLRNDLFDVELYNYVNDALRREKQLKGWQRQWKIDLIEQQNPQWLDLYDQFFKP